MSASHFQGNPVQNPVILTLGGPPSLSGCFREENFFLPVRLGTLPTNPPSRDLITTSSQALYEARIAQSVQ